MLAGMHHCNSFDAVSKCTLPWEKLWTMDMRARAFDVALEKVHRGGNVPCPARQVSPCTILKGDRCTLNELEEAIGLFYVMGTPIKQI